MSSISEQHLQAFHADEVIAHIGAFDQLFDKWSIFCGVEGLVQSFALDATLQRRASWHAIEVVDDEAQLCVTESSHVFITILRLKETFGILWL